MVRRANLETRTNHERWLVSYADFVTLLFAFFVVMYSVSQVSEVKYRELAQTLESAFEDRAADTFGRPSASLDTSSVSSANQHSLADMAQLKQQLSQVIADSALKDKVRLSGNENWLEISLESELVFSSGSSRIEPPIKLLFNDVGDILQPFSNAISVVGHTDNVPISNRQFANNWELSASRAVSVVNFLSLLGIEPSRLSAIGRGSYQPVADNSTVEGRKRNRRVVFRVENMANQSVLETSAVDRGDSSALEELMVVESAASKPTPASSDSDNQPEAVSQPSPAIQPVRLKSGGLLFSSDPDLPREYAP